jgi:Cu(I)/Ag(I) efflux system membrane fusion protein
MTNKLKMVVSTSLALAVGVGGTMLVSSMGDSPEDASSSLESAAHASEGGNEHASHEQAEEDSGAYYTCPMHPSVVSETPGACPVCGMALIKKSKSSTGMDPQELAAMGKVALSPTQRVLANVETAEAVVSSGMTASEIRAVGTVTYDEQGLASIPSWVDGRIEKLLIKETGAVVKEGQPVMEIYSEELLAAQEEYLVALGSSDKTLARPTRQRLKLLGMRDAQIERVRRTKKAEETVTAYAPNPGTITSLKVRQGQYVKEGASLYDIADLSTVWIDADVYERNLRSIEEGMQVRVVADAFSGESMQGEVTFIHPVVNNDTRTVKVRIELDNPEGKLKPGMYASVYFQKGNDGQVNSEIMVPKSAVIRGGKSNNVYVEVEENIFERRQVELGRSTDEFLVVKSGVKSGEKVAYRGGFLLDSEVQLNSFGGSGGAHAGMDMGGEKDGGAKSSGTHKKHKKLTHADIPKEGKKFDPAISADSVPAGAWYCEMNGESHWVQHDEGNGECPVCGMFLKQKGADSDKESK